MQIPYITNTVSGRTQLTLFIGGVPTEVDETHPKFQEIRDNLNTISPQEVRELLDSGRQVRKALAQYGNVTVDADQVMYKGEIVNGFLAERMIQMLEDGIDIRPWALFLENLQQNPAKHAVDELYGWLVKANMPITERGNFLAYKKVADDFTSYHNNPDGSKFRNDIGTFVSMPRNKVDDNRNRTCSSGLHFCSWHYLSSYMGSSGKVVILEINPAHVVSIPSDYNDAKGRAEGYLIVGEIPQDQCEHAFPGTAYVGFEDSDYITFEQDGEIDYSSIEDGWYSDYDENRDDEAEDKAYSQGYEDGEYAAYHQGTIDGFYLSPFDFSFDEEYDAYVDGFRDGFQDNYAQPWHEDEEFAVLPDVDSWTLDEIADSINSGDMDLKDFIEDYEPDSFAITEVVLRIT